MQIVTKLENLNSNFNSENFDSENLTSVNEKTFHKLLEPDIKFDHENEHSLNETFLTPELKITGSIPSWVDLDYNYDPSNPRKPNMRELMEATSGRNVEDLYAEPNNDWQKISYQASEILYGVVGSKEDTRDWKSIMASDNIIGTAREETGLMHGPKVEILSHFDNNNVLKRQTAVIKDREGNNLRELSNNRTNAQEVLRNFGATADSIPENLETSVDTKIFDENLLDFLIGFDHSEEAIEEVALKTASEAISKKLSHITILEHLDKL